VILLLNLSCLDGIGTLPQQHRLQQQYDNDNDMTTTTDNKNLFMLLKDGFFKIFEEIF